MSNLRGMLAALAASLTLAAAGGARALTLDPYVFRSAPDWYSGLSNITFRPALPNNLLPFSLGQATHITGVDLVFVGRVTSPGFPRPDSTLLEIFAADGSTILYSESILYEASAGPRVVLGDLYTLQPLGGDMSLTLAAGDYFIQPSPPSINAWYGRGGDIGVGLRGVAIDVAAVPEPATWALMMLGFGSLGVALRAWRRALA
jgi:hypothetical protein